jgi:hypothetical protein
MANQSIGAKFKERFINKFGSLITLMYSFFRKVFQFKDDEDCFMQLRTICREEMRVVQGQEGCLYTYESKK